MSFATTLPAGEIDLYESIRLQPGQTLSGAGMGVTIINWHGTYDEQTPGVGGNAIVPADDCIIQDLTVNVKTFPYLAGCIGSREADGDGVFNNALIQRVSTNGKSDNFYIRHSQKCSARWIDSELTTNWDMIMLAGNLHECEFSDCWFLADATDYFVQGSYQEANLTTVVGGKVILNRCWMKALGRHDTRGLYTLDPGTQGWVAGSSIEANECFVSAKSPIVHSSGEIYANRCSLGPEQTRLSISHQPGEVTLSWWSDAGHTYQPQRSNDLKTWQPFEPVPGFDGRQQVTVSAEENQQFYRLNIV